jgi:small subunit ribosomal protein S6
LAETREYELVLMLDPGRDAPGRDAVAAEAKKQIEAAGTLVHENAWGLRKLAYEIGRSNEADYRWFRFQAPTTLLEQLDHNLKIADGVLRFRIFKVDAETPVMVPPATAAPGPSASGEGPPAKGAPDADVEAAIEEAPAEPEAPAAVAEPPAEPAPAVPEPAVPEPAPEGSGDEPDQAA